MNTFTASANQASTQSVILHTEICFKCGVLFAMPAEMRESRKRDGQAFYCPAGHGQVYRETEAQRVQRELDYQKKLRGWDQEKIAQLEKDKQSLKFKAMAERGQKIRLQKRIAAGVCPCCTRSFANLARHIEHMHPDFKPTEEKA